MLVFSSAKDFDLKMEITTKNSLENQSKYLNYFIHTDWLIILKGFPCVVGRYIFMIIQDNYLPNVQAIRLPLKAH